MGHFVDKLKKAYSDVLPVEDEDAIGLDIRVKRDHILTRDALAAVALDQAGVDLHPGAVTVIVCDPGLPQKHVAKFLRDIAMPDAGRGSDATHRKLPYYIHEGELKLNRYGSSEWWHEAWQHGSGVVFVVTSRDEIEQSIRKNHVNSFHNLTGPFSHAAAEVVALVCGCDVDDVPESTALENSTWYDLYGCLRPGMTPIQVIGKLVDRGLVSSDDSLDTAVEWLEQLADLPKEKPKLRLRDLSGYGEAKVWGMQLAEDFAAYKAGRLDFEDMDCGILLSGPPGVGKSYFARALSEECSVPLIMCSYADIEMATGKGNLTNKAIKEIWEKARKAAPCIVFMDELDSVGTRGTRDHNSGWFDAVVNGLLAELDGAVPRTGIVAIGATNFPDRIDPALRRPGRLDRHVAIGKPSIDEIPGVIKHHMPADADFTAIKSASVACRGKSHAEIAQFCRDARRSARKNRRLVTCLDIVSAVDSARVKMSPEDDRRSAIHEAAHAVVGFLTGNKCGHVDLDACQTLTEFSTLFPTQEQFTALVLSTLAGRAAEEVVFGEPCGGSVQDLQDATEVVRKMLTQQGFGASRAHVADADYRIRRDLVQAVEERVDELYHRSCGIVRKHLREILRVAARLQRDRYMAGAEVWSTVAHAPLLGRVRPELAYSAPDDNERGHPDNRSRIRYAA